MSWGRRGAKNENKEEDVKRTLSLSTFMPSAKAVLSMATGKLVFWAPPQARNWGGGWVSGGRGDREQEPTHLEPVPAEGEGSGAVAVFEAGGDGVDLRARRVDELGLGAEAVEVRLPGDDQVHVPERGEVS